MLPSLVNKRKERKILLGGVSLSFAWKLGNQLKNQTINKINAT